MLLTVIGCSPAWPNPGGAQSGYLVDDVGRLLLDCGPGVLARLRDNEGWPRVDAIVITHFHLDHWGDLVPWSFGTQFGPGKEIAHPELWLPPGGGGRLRQLGALFGQEDMFESAFALHEYVEGEPFAAAGFVVTAMRVPHYEIETYGLRVASEGSTIAYSGDSAPSEELTEVARSADLFLCEATLADGADEREPRGHLSAEEAVSVFETAQAKRLLLIHRPEELPLASELERAYDGLELTL